MSVRDYLTPEPLMFVTDIARASRPVIPDKRPIQSCQISIYARVSAKRKKLEQERDDCSGREAKLAEMRIERDACTKRYQFKRRRQLEAEILIEEHELQETTSGKKLQDFVDESAPYIKAYQLQKFCRPQAEALKDSASARDCSVIDDYSVALEGAAPRYDIEAKDLCHVCNEAVQLHTALSMLVCVKCGATQPFLDATAALLAYSDDSYDYCSFSYKRINHFTEWISAMQAKETTDIPQTAIDAVMQRLADERVLDTSEVTVHKVREILKKLKLRKYYEHTQLITSKITGKSPPRMTPMQEERIKLLFMAASASFQQHCPPDRSNFLSYSFVLHKFCQLLGYTEFLPYFALLKGREKLRRQDSLFQKICESLDWEFIPSV
jgi:hypothetical protein